MFRRWRVRRAHLGFLESCRALRGARAYWDGLGGGRRFLLKAFFPVPLLGLHEEGHRVLDALEWLESRAPLEPLQENTLKHYHRLLRPGGEEAPGEYRTRKAAVVGSSIPRADPERIRVLLQLLDRKLADEQARLDAARPAAVEDVVRLAADVYQRVGLIHPFGDGNGRVARLALNHLTRRYGLGYAILPPLTAEAPLWTALQEAHRSRPAALEAILRAALRPV